MSKLPIISGKIAIGVFIKMGYKFERQRGSHIRLSHLQKKSVTIPNHKTIGKGLLRNADISVNDFINLLKD